MECGTELVDGEVTADETATQNAAAVGGGSAAGSGFAALSLVSRLFGACRLSNDPLIGVR